MSKFEPDIILGTESPDGTLLRSLDRTSDYLAENWVNGNRSDVLEILESTSDVYGPCIAITLSIRVAWKLETRAVIPIPVSLDSLEFWSAIYRHGSETWQELSTDGDPTEPDPLDYQL